MDCRDTQCFNSFKRESNQESTVFLMPQAVPVWNKYQLSMFLDDLQGKETLQSGMAFMLLGASLPTDSLVVNSPKAEKGK